jgi:integrase
VAYRHGLRAVEICDLEWSQVEFDRSATLHVRRAKNGKPATHPIRGDELRALRELQRQTSGGYVFETERGTPFTTDAVNRLVKRIGERASFPFKVSRAHATARLRLRPGQSGPRHAGHSGLAWPSRDPAHRPLYGIKPRAVQGFLANLKSPAFAFPIFVSQRAP